ncbi:BC1881 family protein [Limosilactobacillus reuteri]|nr:BC1881 family protein [Limosilactobacillus reuteri]
MSEFSTKELTNELANREGVEEIRIEPYDTVLVDGTEIEGPARILINTD